MSRAPASHDVFRAIADPGRRRMLDAMLERERDVSELTALMGLSQPAVSQHLQVLRAVGLVHERRQGRHRYFKANAAELRTVADWVAKYEAFWTAKLSALEAHLARRTN